MGRERLSNADTVMLRAEDPANPNSAVGVMVFGAPIDYEDLLATFESRILRIGRFRQHVVQPLVPWARPYWEDDPDFDLRYHVQRAVLPGPGDEGALLETVSLLAGLPLDFRRPLWQIFLVERYDPGPQAHTREGSVLISRLHHSLGDGLALMQVMLSVADGSSRDPQEAGEPKPAADPRHSHRPRS